MPVEGVMLEPPALSTLVIARLGKLSVSVAVLAVPMGGVTVAVFDTVPVAVELTVPVIVYVIALLAGRLTPVWLMLPVPLVAKPVALALPVLAAVQVSPVRSAGIGSLIVAPATLPGPVLLTTTV